MSKTINFNCNYNEKSSVVTFGNFDGVHLGHLNLINTLVNRAKKNKTKSVLITFNPHTRSIIWNKGNKFITSYNEKIKLLKLTGLDYIITIDFDKEFSKIAAKKYIQLIRKKYNPKEILLGYDNKFGNRGEGNYEFLLDYLTKSNIRVIKYEPFEIFGNKVKSSKIKQLITNGDVSSAKILLGRAFSLDGKIIKGNKKGRAIGYPTANLDLHDIQQIIPKVGVYSVNFKIGHSKYRGICNIGCRPTFEYNGSLSIETYIIEEENFNLYDKNVCIEFVDFIRDEKKFSNKDILVKQIRQDIREVLN